MSLQRDQAGLFWDEQEANGSGRFGSVRRLVGSGSAGSVSFPVPPVPVPGYSGEFEGAEPPHTLRGVWGGSPPNMDRAVARDLRHPIGARFSARPWHPIGARFSARPWHPIGARFSARPRHPMGSELIFQNFHIFSIHFLFHFPGSSGSVFMAGSTGSGSKTVRFPVHGSVLTLPGHQSPTSQLENWNVGQETEHHQRAGTRN